VKALNKGNGFRIDHAFFSSAPAKRAGVVRYSHAEREAGLSDHSVLPAARPQRWRQHA